MLRRSSRKKNIFDDSEAFSDSSSNFPVPLASSSPRSSVNISTVSSEDKWLEAAQTLLRSLNEKKIEENNVNSVIESLTLPEIPVLKQKATINTLRNLRELASGTSSLSSIQDRTIDSTQKRRTNSQSKTTLVESSEGDKTVRSRANVVTLPRISEEGRSPEPNNNKRVQIATKDEVFLLPTGQTCRSKKTNSEAMKTPGNGSGRSYCVATVTPGPGIRKPISVLRQPLPGEMAISMSGSPLLIHRQDLPAVPTISIPLANGKVVTVLADENMDPDISLFAEVDTPTKERFLQFGRSLERKRKEN